MDSSEIKTGEQIWLEGAAQAQYDIDKIYKRAELSNLGVLTSDDFSRIKTLRHHKWRCEWEAKTAAVQDRFHRRARIML